MEEKSLLGVAALAGGAVGGAATAFFAANKRLGEIMDTAAGAGSQKFEVNKDNILKAVQIISTQLDSLTRKFGSSKSGLMIRAVGDADPITVSVVTAWNNNLVLDDDSYAKRVQQYIESLSDLLDQLRAAAQEYGFTEEQIKSRLAGGQSA
ncbi:MULTISPECIES: hypothetical protein [Actinosynnema]|uniref:hypothetical protein n=1 Tax=Actinosynnema TaxID=40566 RepID=UPI0020A31DBB|nr:hypothetical protein [Actinosynnema pretiosum]MCP2093702.1 hypothetical protein [Actinosynnema pretiosum]